MKHSALSIQPISDSVSCGFAELQRFVDVAVAEIETEMNVPRGTRDIHRPTAVSLWALGAEC